MRSIGTKPRKWAIKHGMKKLTIQRTNKIIANIVKQTSCVGILGTINIHCLTYNWAMQGVDLHLNAMFPSDKNFGAVSYFREVYSPASQFCQTLQQARLLNALKTEATEKELGKRCTI